MDSLLGAPAAPAPSGGGGLFDSMTIKSAPAPAPAVPTPPAPAATPSSGFDFMNSGGGGGDAPAPAPPPAAAAGGFDFMQQNTASSLEEVGQAAAASGSAFSFMGDAAGGPTSTKASFDPLNKGYQPSPGSQKPALDAVQLQAMYAQQNMMMMQQQMQQMQLAMAMQQQKMQNPTQQRKGSNPNVMVPGVGGFNTTSSFSFLDHGAQPPGKKEDKKFDFVQDAMRNEKKK